MKERYWNTKNPIPNKSHPCPTTKNKQKLITESSRWTKLFSKNRTITERHQATLWNSQTLCNRCLRSLSCTMPFLQPWQRLAPPDRFHKKRQLVNKHITFQICHKKCLTIASLKHKDMDLERVITITNKRNTRLK